MINVSSVPWIEPIALESATIWSALADCRARLVGATVD